MWKENSKLSTVPTYLYTMDKGEGERKMSNRVELDLRSEALGIRAQCTHRGGSERSHVTKTIEDWEGRQRS